MRRTTGIATALATAGLLAAGIMGPASAAPSNKGTTSIEPSPTTLDVYKGTARPGNFDGKSANFGVVGNPNDGTIEHVGGLYVYSPASKSTLELRNFTIDTNRGIVTGIVNDSFRAPLFYFDVDDAEDGEVTLYFTETASDAVVGDLADIEGVKAGVATIVLR